MRSRDAAFTVLGGSVTAAYGFTALVTSTYLNSSQLPTGTFLALWTSTILVLALGFVVIVSGYLMAASGRLKRIAGGVMGVLAAFSVAFVDLILVTTTFGINPSLSSSSQYVLASELLFVGSIIALFLGFPLSMFGTVSAITERNSKDETSEIPEAPAS